jgi:L-rhamnose-H+ transport protein
VLLAGTALVIFGIVLCSVGGARRSPSTSATPAKQFTAGLVIAISAGVLSCLPNIGMAFAGNVTTTATKLGVSQSNSGNTVWALLFTLGCAVNLFYCLYLMIAKKTLAQYWTADTPRNLGLSAAMALMWIASFYLYGAGAARLGHWGVVVGWPLFISLSIVTGNLWGLWRGEWQGAPPQARRWLNIGLVILIFAVITVALSNSF